MSKPQLKRLIDSMVKEAIEQYLTKTQQPITFKVFDRSPDRSDQADNGWVIHKIEAHVNGEVVGWIKLSYIPKTVAQKQAGSILDWLQNFEGRTYLAKYDRKDPEQYRKLLGNAAGFDVERYSIPAQLSNEEILDIIKDKHGKRYKKFINFHVDRPLVDYISVKEEFQRQRIGIALYEYAAKWLAQKGLKLYASGLQSDQAKAAWEWLRANKGANIGTDKSTGETRTFLSYL